MADSVRFPGYDLPPVRSGDDVAAALAAISALWPVLAESLASVAQRLGVTGAATVAVVRLPLVNLARLVNSLPATEAGAEHEPGSLFRHSVQVADRTLALADEDWPRLQGLAEAKDRVRFRTLAWYAGLVHEIGRIRHHRVEANGKQWSRFQYLSDFLAQFPAGQRDYDLAHERGRTRRGITGHEPFAGIALTSIIPGEVLYRWLSTAQANNLQAALFSSLGAQGTLPLGSYLRKADTAVRSGGVPAPQTSQSPGKPHAFGAGDLVSDFIAGFQAVRNDSRLRYNTPDAHLLLSPSHTVVVASERRNGTSLFRIIHGFIGQQIANANIGGAAKAFYAGTDVFGIIGELEARAGRTRPPLCLASEPEQGPRSVLHVCLISQERASRRVEALVMPNALLWGDVPLAPYGFFTGGLQFFCRDGTAPSLDPEEFGFHPPAEAAGPRTTLVGDLAASAPAGPLVALESEERAVAQLWEEIARLFPLPPASGAAGELVRHIEEARRNGIRRDQVGALIEACTDRLRLAGARPEPPAATAPAHVAPIPPVSTPVPAPTPATAPVPAPPSIPQPRPGAVPTKPAISETLAKAVGTIAVLLATPGTEGGDPRLPCILKDGRHWLLPWPAILEPLLSKADIVRIYQMTSAVCRQCGIPEPVRLSLVNRAGETRRIQVLRLGPEDSSRLAGVASPALASLPMIVLDKEWSLLREPIAP